VNIGNEAWFGRTALPLDLLAANVFRAVENRTAVARAVNTGISGFIDPFGRIVAVVERDGEMLFVDGFATTDLPVRGTTTFYTRFGDLFATSNVALVTVVILLAIAKSVAVRLAGSGRRWT